MIDSHAHLNFGVFKEDLDRIIDDAKSVGVRGIVSICTKLDEVCEIKTIAGQYNAYVCYSIGVHPDYADVTLKTYSVDKIYDMLISEKDAVAIGECGFDFRNGDEQRQSQREVFNAHVNASVDTNKVLVVHTRNAEEDTKDVLSSKDSIKKVILHCFTGSMDFARFALDKGYYISFSGIVTFKNARDLQDIARFVPLDRMLVETDAPFLAPVPMRGKVNEPSYVMHTAAFIADLKGVSIEDVDAYTTQNFKKLFFY